jgi:hypothetical protein
MAHTTLNIEDTEMEYAMADVLAETCANSSKHCSDG